MAENNQMQGWNQPSRNKKNYPKINKTRSLFFEKINKIDKLLARLTRGYKDSIQINKIRNEKGDITTETEEIEKKSKDPTTQAVKSGWNRQLSRYIPGANVKIGSDKLSK